VQAVAQPRLGLVLSERMLNMPPEVRKRAHMLLPRQD
jgi:hypothetical protein